MYTCCTCLYLHTHLLLLLMYVVCIFSSVVCKFNMIWYDMINRRPFFCHWIFRLHSTLKNSTTEDTASPWLPRYCDKVVLYHSVGCLNYSDLQTTLKARGCFWIFCKLWTPLAPLPKNTKGTSFLILPQTSASAVFCACCLSNQRHDRSHPNWVLNCVQD